MIRSFSESTRCEGMRNVFCTSLTSIASSRLGGDSGVDRSMSDISVVKVSFQRRFGCRPRRSLSRVGRVDRIHHPGRKVGVIIGIVASADAR